MPEYRGKIDAKGRAETLRKYPLQESNRINTSAFVAKAKMSSKMY
jgi:hypothetical protein